MPRLPANPFIYGRPVQGEQFFGRQKEIDTVLSRLRNGESTAIVGGPHIGKTSLLIRLADKDVLTDRLGADVTSKIISSMMNLHDLPSSYTPVRFWEDALEPLRANPGNSAIISLLQKAQQAGYDRPNLEKLFVELAKSGCRLFLLLDEFELILKHKNFQEHSFFSAIRILSSSTDGLAIVTASRLNISDMNELGRGLMDVGSPLFNMMIEVRLKPFDDSTIDQFFSQPGSVVLTLGERAFIQRMAGRHPFVLQAMAAAFQENPTHPDVASEICYEGIKFHFQDLWISLPENCRTAAVILSFSELGGIARGKKISLESIKNNKKFDVELEQLVEYGLAERVKNTGYWIYNWDYFFSSGNERWAVATLLFARWVCYQVETDTDGLVADWIKRKQYGENTLTPGEWQEFQDIGRNHPNFAKDSLRSLAIPILSYSGKGE